MAMLRDSGESEDVLQDAMFRAWKSIAQVRSAGQLRGWFLTIVANRSRSIRTARRWSEVRWPHFRVATRTSLERVVDQREDLVRALHRLSPEDRAVVYLRFYEDMSTRDLARALGLSEGAAR